MSNLKLLELVDIFSDLSSEQLAEIDKICVQETYFQGETIFEENSPSTGFFVILDGEIEIQINIEPAPGGETRVPVTIATLRKGQSFGEIALVDQGVRSASARCATMTCKVANINRDDFMNLLRKDLDMGFKVMSSLAADLCFRIRQSNITLRQALLNSSKIQPV